MASKKYWGITFLILQINYTLSNGGDYNTPQEETLVTLDELIKEELIKKMSIIHFLIK